MKRLRLIRRHVGMGLLVVLLLGAGLLIPAQVARAAPETAVAATVLADRLYIVKAGDTLSQIARWYGTTVRAIMEYNGLHSTTIYVGQRLTIPTGPPPPADYWWYEVRAGDTLYRIATRYGTTVKTIMRINGLHSTDIYVGQWLKIPGYAPPPPPPSEVWHHVRYGDTLSQIARWYGTTVRAIMDYNGLTSTRIYAGQWLKIPA